MFATGQQDGFSIEIARKLLLMVERARDEFRSPLENWWEINGDFITIDNEDYEVLTRFGFDQYWFGIKNIVGTVFNRDTQIQKREPFGFILQKDNDIFIAIRGTQTKPEWINNINFKPDTEDFLNKAKLGKVHKGFDRIYTNDRPIANILPNSLGNSLGAQKIDSIGESIQKTLEKCSKDNPEARVYVVGHSLGAALATLAYAHINDLQYFNNPATLYTFASPRVGTKDFFENLKDLPIYRIFNTEDIITYFPFPSVAPFSNSGSADPILNQSLKGSGIGPLRNFLGKLDFYHVGKPLAFCLHKESILENHIIATYLEGLNKL